MKENIIRMAREAGWPSVAVDNLPGTEDMHRLERFAALVAAAERNKLAQWMIDHSYATGHGDTTEDLLDELDWQITESWSKVVMTSVGAEREACAKYFDDSNYMMYRSEVAAAIRARGQDAA